MKKVLALALLLVATSAIANGKTKLLEVGDDDPYRLFSLENLMTNNTTIELIVHDSEAKVNAVCQGKMRAAGNKNGFGYKVYACTLYTKSLFGGHKCEIHMARKTDQNQLGHEVRHCFVGQFHK